MGKMSQKKVQSQLGRRLDKTRTRAKTALHYFLGCIYTTLSVKGLIFFSSVSVWVKNCDDLQLAEDAREKLDKQIDQMYEDLERGTIGHQCSLDNNEYIIHLQKPAL